MVARVKAIIQDAPNPNNELYTFYLKFLIQEDKVLKKLLKSLLISDTDDELLAICLVFSYFFIVIEKKQSVD